jgi:hypothetical protein
MLRSNTLAIRGDASAPSVGVRRVLLGESGRSRETTAGCKGRSAVWPTFRSSSRALDPASQLRADFTQLVAFEQRDSFFDVFPSDAWMDISSSLRSAVKDHQLGYCAGQQVTGAATQFRRSKPHLTSLCGPELRE